MRPRHGRRRRRLVRGLRFAVVSVALLTGLAIGVVLIAGGRVAAGGLLAIAATLGLCVAALVMAMGAGRGEDEPPGGGDHTAGAATPPRRDRGTGRKLGRREALQLLGLGAAAAVPLPILSKLSRDVAAAGSATSPRAAPAAAAAQGPNGRIRQWAMVIDLRSCDGCQSVGSPPRCTTACIEGHFVPEPMEWIEVFEQELEGEGTRFLPAPCLQCQNAPCVNVCPVAATFHTPEGTVLIDQDRCIGCRICMAACPYDRRFFAWGDPPVPPEALLASYDIEHQVPARNGTVMKCDFCPEMARAGVLPYCAQACPHGAIYYGDLEEDLATNGREVVLISEFIAAQDAFKLKHELGTDPRVFYVPGHGEAVGRVPSDEGRLPTEWPWQERARGAGTWTR